MSRREVLGMLLGWIIGGAIVWLMTGWIQQASAYDDEPEDTITAYLSHEVEFEDYILCFYDSYRGTIVLSVETWSYCPQTIQVPR